jgi:hypothetical protein
VKIVLPLYLNPQRFPVSLWFSPVLPSLFFTSLALSVFLCLCLSIFLCVSQFLFSPSFLFSLPSSFPLSLSFYLQLSQTPRRDTVKAQSILRKRLFIWRKHNLQRSYIIYIKGNFVLSLRAV